ncbi:MAG: hypothetical protein ACR2KW_04630 [Rubrobacter sp.]
MRLPRVRAVVLLLLFVVLLGAGCSRTEGVPLEPLPSGSGGMELRLGPGVRAMSEGPGYKSSPAWSPDGSRLAFVVDGYVVDKPASGSVERRWTPLDFGAQSVAWDSARSLNVSLRPDSNSDTASSEEGVKTTSLYSIPRPSGASADSREISLLAEDVISSEQGSSAAGALIATLSGSESVISLVRGGVISNTYPESASGFVTGISASPDRTKAVLSIRTSEAGEGDEYRLTLLDLVDGSYTDFVILQPGRHILGSPQWSSRGIYYLEGEETGDSASAETTNRTYASQRILLVQNGANGPYSRPAPGPGSGFTASGIRLSPDGEELAVIGRLRSDSPTNVYVLNLQSSELRSLTENEDMEIKNGPNDLAWSPDGESLAIVARGISTTGLRVYPAQASALLEAFYNVYRVPVER